MCSIACSVLRIDLQKTSSLHHHADAFWAPLQRPCRADVCKDRIWLPKCPGKALFEGSIKHAPLRCTWRIRLPTNRSTWNLKGCPILFWCCRAMQQMGSWILGATSSKRYLQGPSGLEVWGLGPGDLGRKGPISQNKQNLCNSMVIK